MRKARYNSLCGPAGDWIGCGSNPCDQAITIGYTTLGMQKNETQTLTASVALDSLTWAISAGGGSLNQSTGASVIYTAPATNASCANNPTITLSCNGVAKDHIHIAVNAYTASDEAYITKKCYAEGYCTGTDAICAVVRIWRGTCAGVEAWKGSSNWCGGGNGPPTAPCPSAFCDGAPITSKASTCALAALRTSASWPSCRAFSDKALNVASEKRTAGMITAGCCPAALL